MNVSKIKIGVSLVMIAGSVSCAGIADFYALDSVGNIFSVNGSTLEASHVIDLGLGGGLAVNDLLYLSDGGILVNNGRDLVRYDVGTGEQRVVFDGRTSLGSDSIMMGMAATTDGTVFMSVLPSFANPGTDWYGATYDPFTSEFNRLADIENPTGLYFDHHQIGENLFLGADWSGQRISVIDSLSGETTFYEVDFAPVSFFESNGEVYSVGKGGGIYTFDILTGESDLYGVIGGDIGIGGWIGAASTSAPFLLPAPSSLAFLGFAGIAATRRRR